MSMTESTDPLPPLREVIRRHGLAARRRLGQNFLLDMNLTRRIARAAGPLQNRTVVEIGPGPGGLTRALLAEGADRIVAIEQDARCIPALEEIAACYPKRLEIIEGDAMEIDQKAVAGGGPVKIVGNLPYNIATPLLFGWLGVEIWPPWWQSLTLMFQREVAERIVATPGTKAFGRLSVMGQWRSRPTILFNVNARAFVPPPQITSTVIQIEPCEPVDSSINFSDLSAVVKSAFSQRRKMLRSSLRSIMPEPAEWLNKASIDPTVRADSLDVASFCRLTRVWAEINQRDH